MTVRYLGIQLEKETSELTLYGDRQFCCLSQLVLFETNNLVSLHIIFNIIILSCGITLIIQTLHYLEIQLEN